MQDVTSTGPPIDHNDVEYSDPEGSDEGEAMADMEDNDDELGVEDGEMLTILARRLSMMICRAILS